MVPHPGKVLNDVTGESFALLEVSVIGRSHESTVPVLDPRVSRRHAMIRRQDDGFWFFDLGSINGSLINDRRVTTSQKLASGDVIRIADHTPSCVRFRRELRERCITRPPNRRTSSGRIGIACRPSSRRCASPASGSISPSNPMEPYYVGLASQPLSDLSFLKGAPISSLVVHNCKITDLTPLRDLPLKYLNLDWNPVTDLSALRGIPLELLLLPTAARNLDLLRKMPNLKTLDFKYIDAIYTVGSTPEDFWKKMDALGWIRALNDTGIPYSASEIMENSLDGEKGTGMWSVRIASKDFSDCSIFKGAANIRELNLADSAVTDLAPLADCKELKSLILPPYPKDIEFLRTFPKLERLGFTYDPKTFVPEKTAAEFWKEWDAKKP